MRRARSSRERAREEDTPGSLEGTFPVEFAKGFVGGRGRWKLPHVGRRWGWTAGVLVGLVIVAVVASFFVDEPLRRAVERNMNERLQGYSVSIERLSFHPLGFSLTLSGVTFVQNEHPDPPVLHLPRLDASVQWKALLMGGVVANFRVDNPRLYVNRAQLQKEAEDATPVEKRGWQEAVQAIYPLQINEFKIVDGDVTYVDTGPFRPLHLSRLNVVAYNIRNVRSRKFDYPSDIRLEGVLFDSGKVLIEGNADFLAVPHLGLKANVALEDIDLEYFQPILERYNVSLKKGTVSAWGLVEYAPEIKVVDLKDAVIRGVHLDYVHSPAQTGVVQRTTAKTAEAAREVSNEPQILLRAAEIRVVDSTVGFVNKAATPAYRAFLADTTLTVKNFSNQLAEGTMEATLRAKFMGSGATAAVATFRPETKGPDFDLDVRIESTDMKAMNDMLRAYGKFDVAAGAFSLFSELRVKNGQINGYVKPLFGGLDVYSAGQDREKGFGRKLYEKVVEGASKLLRNAPRKEVATVAEIAGPVGDANANTWQVIVKLIQNAFFKAILPGFTREASGKP
jgi:Domain of Unknown Function (DUF748)